MFAEFISQLGPLKNGEIPFSFRNQFKIRENFINPNSKHFDGIVQKLIAEEKQGMKRKWDKQCKMMFIWVLGKFFQLKNKKSVNPNQKEWTELAELLKTEESILKQRWITLINPFSKTITWDPEEDEIIRSLMNQQEEKHIWTQIALELYNNNNGQYVRTPKQVRERWMNYLNPKLKKSIWTLQEDTQLLEIVIKHGKRWSFISNLLQGRTENQVKNRFKSLIQKISKEEEQDDLEEIQAIKDYLQKIDAIKNNQEQKNEGIQEPSLQEEIEKKEKRKKQKIQTVPKIKKTTQKKEKVNLKQEEIMQPNQIVEKQEEIQQNFVKQNEPIAQDPMPLVYQPPSQFYDTNIQTPNTLSYYLQPQMQQFDYKQQMMFQTYRPFIDDFSQQQQQLTPQQIIMEQYIKRQSGYNMLSPYPKINQTPMTYTPVQPMYAFNNQFVVRSPQMMCSPFLENQSPSLQSQYWQYQQQQMEQIQQEQLKQAQFNNKMEFLNQNNLLDDWKRKRDSKKINQIFQSIDQQDQ